MDYTPHDKRRFEQYVDKDGTGCWQWLKSRTGKGVPAFSLKGRSIPAHRFSWAITNGPIPKSMYVIHVCPDPGCLNPEHLQAMTMSQRLKMNKQKDKEAS